MKIYMIGQKGMPAVFGGVERHVHELSVRLVKAGHDVTVYARKWYSPATPAEFAGVKIKYLPTLHTKHLDTIIHAFLATIAAIKNKPDIIHYHGVGPSLVSWIPKIFSPQTRVVTTFHSMDRKHEKWGWFARLILKFGEWTACNFADQTIAVSKTIQQYCRDVYDIEAVFIPNGVPLYRKEATTNLLEKWLLKKNQYIIMLSRLIPHKGAHYLIKAFNELCLGQPKIMEGYKLAIVGDGYFTNDYVDHLKDLAKDNPQIVFTGFQTDKTLAQLLSHAKLMVHPSDNEGTPLTVLEGMSYNLPVLLSDIPEHLELVKDRKYLFVHGDISDLIAKLYAVLTTDSQSLAMAGEFNKNLVKEEYDWDSIIKKTSQLYQEPLEKKKLEKIATAIVN